MSSAARVGSQVMVVGDRVRIAAPAPFQMIVAVALAGDLDQPHDLAETAEPAMIALHVAGDAVFRWRCSPHR
jgi:hypothetical protein